MLMIIGIPVGFVFALVALSISVVSFPMLLGRDVVLPALGHATCHLCRRAVR